MAQKPVRSEVFLRASRHPLAGVVGRALDGAGVSIDASVVLAVSGGSDSMAMMLLVGAIRARQDGALRRTAVVSVDHGLRDESRAEAELVGSLATDLGFGWAQARRVQVARDGNLLDAARRARFAACRSACVEFGSDTLLVAHQAEDRAESLLIALGRGMGVEALAALRPAREFDDGIRVVRPMLDCRRADLREFLGDLGVDWVEDPSNALHDRGSLRNDGPSAELVARIVDGCGPLFADGVQLLDLRDGLAAAALPIGQRSIGRAAFEALHPVVRAEVLIRMARHAGIDLRRSVVDQVSALIDAGDRSPHAYACSGRRTLLVDRERLEIVAAAPHS
jgi:tRNA(Ile)-lysidine synthetase-like protein